METMPMTSVSIKKLVMVESGTYNDLMMRPYKSQLNDASVLHAFAESTEGGANVTPTTLSGIAGMIVKPTATPNAMVGIVNGWDIRRFSFLMEIQHSVGHGHMGGAVITGYCDHAGYSTSGFIDPNMRMYFNNIVQLNTIVAGGIPMTSMVNTSQLIATPVVQGQQNLNMHSMRPTDVISAMRNNLMAGEVYDLRTSFVDQLKKSRRTNSISPHYVSNVINGLIKSKLDPEAPVYQTEMDMYGAARDRTRDPLIGRDPFFSVLLAQTDFANTGFVTYGDLCRMFPGVDQLCVFTPAKALTRSGMPLAARGDSEYWSATTTEAVIATILSNTVPSIMLELMITKCVVIAHNETMDGSIYVEIRNPMSFTNGIDMVPYLMRFEERLKFEVFRDLTHNGLINFRIQMIVDVAGDSRFSVSFASQPAVEFTMPSFCDNLSSPILTNNSLDVHSLATDLDNIFQNQNIVQTKDGFTPYAPPPMQMQSPGIVQQPPSQMDDPMRIISGNH